MSDEQRSGTGFFTRLLAFTFVLVIVAGIGTYAMGWMNFAHDGETTTVEVESGEIKRAAGEATEAGKKLLDNTEEAVEEAASEVEEAGEEGPAEEEPTEEEPAEEQPPTGNPEPEDTNDEGQASEGGNQ